MKIKELLEYGRKNLIECDEPYRLSKILLKHLLKVNDSYLVIHQDMKVEKDIEEKFCKGINLLNDGKPIQYITNNQEFMKMNFYVDENVLIPQPDTEVLVEEIIDICKGRSCAFPMKNDKLNVGADASVCPKKCNILDLCTGSGAIGVSLAKNIENSNITMSDISSKALEIAKKNAEKNNVMERCKFIQSDMFENINEKFDVIVSNPPYIKTEVINQLDKQVQNEPMLALDGGQNGLKFYKIIAKEAWKYLKQDGLLALEIGYDQKKDVIKLLKKSSKYIDIYSKKDLSGNDRIIVCKFNEEEICHLHQI